MNTKQAIGFTGTGVFLYLILASLEFTFSRLLHESLIWTQGNEIVIHALTVYIPVVIIIGLFIYTLKWIRRNWNKEKDIKSIFKSAVVIYIIVGTFQFGMSMLEGLYQDKVYFDLLESYRSTLNEHHMYRQLLIDTPAWIIQYAVIGILIYKEMKALPDST